MWGKGGTCDQVVIWVFSGNNVISCPFLNMDYSWPVLNPEPAPDRQVPTVILGGLSSRPFLICRNHSLTVIAAHYIKRDF